MLLNESRMSLDEFFWMTICCWKLELSLSLKEKRNPRKNFTRGYAANGIFVTEWRLSVLHKTDNKPPVF